MARYFHRMITKLNFRFSSSILFAVLIVPALAVSQPKDGKKQERYTRADYINLYAGFAVEEMIMSGVPASITLAQGIIESGDGNS